MTTTRQEEVIAYLARYKDTYARADLEAQLVAAGHDATAIAAGARIVYGAGNDEVSLRYASIGARVVAMGIDGAIVLVVTGTFGSIVALTALTAIEDVTTIGMTIVALLPTMLQVVVVGAMTWMTYRYQATPGKMAMGLRVVAADGTPLSLGRVLLREVVGKSLGMLSLGGGFLMAVFTDRHRALHDMMADSVVVYKKA